MRLRIYLLALLFISACSSSPSLSPSADLSPIEPNPTGKVRVRMHDLPIEGFDVQQVLITILRVEIGSEERGWTVVNDTEQTHDLLTLVDNVSVVLGEVELAAGEYDQIRLILSEENAVIADGVSQPLKVPSGQQTGIKLDGPFTIGSGQIVEIVLDFDAQKSIHWNRGQGFMLKPVVQIESVTSGGGSFISGDVRAGEGGVLSLPDGFELRIPPGALPSDQQITIETIPVEHFGISIYSNEYILGPAGLIFNLPLQARVPYFEDAVGAKGIPERNLVAMLDYEAVAESVVDEAANTVTAPIVHFSSIRVECNFNSPLDGDKCALVFARDEIPLLKRAYLPFGYRGRPAPLVEPSDFTLVLPDDSPGFGALLELMDPRPENRNRLQTRLDLLPETSFPDYPVTRIDDNTDAGLQWHIVTEWDVNETTSNLGQYYKDFDKDGRYDFHTGEDWNEGGPGADINEEVYSMGAGQVIYKGSGFGNSIAVLHKVRNPGRLDDTEFVVSFYHHLSKDGFLGENPLVREGNPVSAFRHIARVGDTGPGNEGAHHLHFEVRGESMLGPVFPGGITLNPNYPPNYWPASPRYAPADEGEGSVFIRQNYYDPTEFIKTYTGQALLNIGEASPDLGFEDCLSGFRCREAAVSAPSAGILIVDLRYAPGTGDDDYDLIVRPYNFLGLLGGEYLSDRLREAEVDTFDRNERVVVWRGLDSPRDFHIEIQNRGNPGGSDDAELDTFVSVSASFFPFEDPRLPIENPIIHRSKFFWDVLRDDPDFEDVRLLYDFGILSGSDTTPGFFSPGANVTLAEFLKMLVTAVNARDSLFDPCYGSDIWYSRYFAAARDLGILRIDADECPDPESTINGPTAVLYLQRAFGGSPEPSDSEKVTRLEAVQMIAHAIRHELSLFFP